MGICTRPAQDRPCQNFIMDKSGWKRRVEKSVQLCKHLLSYVAPGFAGFAFPLVKQELVFCLVASSQSCCQYEMIIFAKAF